MELEYAIGDMLDGPELFNAQGIMGPGVAKQIRAKYPDAYRSYKKEYDTNGLKLGNVYRHVCNGKMVFNCITQENFGRAIAIQMMETALTHPKIMEEKT